MSTQPSRLYVKCPQLSTRCGWLVKIGFNLVHVVIECPQRAKIGSPPLFQLRVYNQIIFFDVCTALAEISTDCLTQVKALMHFFLIVIKRCHRAYTKLWSLKSRRSSYRCMGPKVHYDYFLDKVLNIKKDEKVNLLCLN